MFDLAKCQNRVKFIEFFGKWFESQIPEMQKEVDHNRYSPYGDAFLRSDFGRDIATYGVVAVNRNIDYGGAIQMKLALNKEIGRNCFWGGDNVWVWPDDTKERLIRTYLGYCWTGDWRFEEMLMYNFLKEMRDLPGYLKSFDEIREEG